MEGQREERAPRRGAAGAGLDPGLQGRDPSRRRTLRRPSGPGAPDARTFRSRELDAVLTYLQRQCGARRVGVVGFCWGGVAAHHVMMTYPGLRAGVSVYGKPAWRADAVEAGGLGEGRRVRRGSALQP